MGLETLKKSVESAIRNRFPRTVVITEGDYSYSFRAIGSLENVTKEGEEILKRLPNYAGSKRRILPGTPVSIATIETEDGSRISGLVPYWRNPAGFEGHITEDGTINLPKSESKELDEFTASPRPSRFRRLI